MTEFIITGITGSSEIIIEQRSDEWFSSRKGKITSSEIYKIIGEGKTKGNNLSETAKTYLLTKVAEELGGHTDSMSSSGIASLKWGIDLEDTAISFYERIKSTKVDKASFIQYSDYYGGSPDGLVLPDGIIEVKCPYNSTNHFKHGMIKTNEDFKKIAPNYYYQCLSNIICAKSDWCDFISFDPRVHSNYNMFIFRLNRNEEDVKNLLERVEIANEYMQEIRKTLRNINIE
jgi:exodeoxyribonuclease (lambda-induced)